MTIRLVCVRCGREMASHAGSFDIEAGLYRCPDGELASEGSMLLDSHALDDVPPSERAAARRRICAEATRRLTHPPRPDFDQRVDFPERFTDGPI